MDVRRSIKLWRIAIAGVVLAVGIIVLGSPREGTVRAQSAQVEVTLDARYLSADTIGGQSEATLFLRVIGVNGAPVPAASVQWASSDPARIAVMPASGVTSAQGSAITRLAAQPRAARGPVTITSRVTLPSGEPVVNTQIVYIAGPLARLVPSPAVVALTSPGERATLTVYLLDESGLPAADGVPVAFSITKPAPLNVISFVEMPGPFISRKSKEGKVEVTVLANQLGTATVLVQASTVQQEIAVIVGAVATPTPTPTATPAASPPAPPAVGTWEPTPQAGVWTLTYWQGDAAPIESAAQAAPQATLFWVLRNEGGSLRFLGYAKTAPEASDQFTVRRGEAAFVQ